MLVSIKLPSTSRVDQDSWAINRWRITVYVSAQFLLSRFPGKRTEHVYSTSHDALTNLWPNLLMREEELRTLRSEYSTSFLVRILPDPLSARLWTNPDDTRQVRMAMRY